MRLIVTGGRDYCETAHIFFALDDLHERKTVSVLIEGEADGLDVRAKAWARQRGIDIDPYPAPWDDLHHPDAVVRFRRDGTPYDVNAGPRRNQQMIDDGKPDYGMVFPGGRGTADMRRRLITAGIPFEEVC